ncbi:MAG TPA: hypothetical protein VI078_01000 [bacterium]
MKKLLITSYWIGIVADALATLLLFSPAVSGQVLRPLPYEITPMYLYVSRVTGALMLGWTVLLFWGQRRPVERADLLLITLAPVTVMAGAAVAVARSGQIPLSSLVPMFVLYAVLYGTFLPSYFWARKRRSGAGAGEKPLTRVDL